MNRFQTMAAAAMLAAGIQGAQAIDLTLNIDDASRVSVSVANQQREVVNGENRFTVDDYAYVEVKGVDPYAVRSVTNAGGTYVGSIYNGNWSTTICPGESDYTYSVTTYNMDDERTGTFTLVVDDASLINAVRGGNPISGLHDGANPLKFNPANEQYLTINSNDYQKSLYSVTVNDEPQRVSNSVTVTLTEGCVVNVTAKVPAEPATVSFVFPDEDLTAAIKATVDGNPVTITEGKIVESITTGQTLALSFSDAYMIEELKFNGNNCYAQGFSQQLLSPANTIEVKGHKYGTIKATLVMNEPEAVRLYNGYSGYGLEPLSVGTDGTIEFSENNTMLSWEVAAGYLLNSVKVNGVVQQSGYAQIADGDSIIIDAAKIEMDKKAVFFIDGDPKALTYFQIECNDANRTVLDLSQGYNEVEFYDGMAQMRFSFYNGGTPLGGIYQNGQAIADNYGSYEFTLADCDVIKIYLADAPEEAKLTLSVEPDCAATVVADHLTDITAQSEVALFKGTELTFGGNDIEVTVDGVKLADPSAVFTVTGNHAISIAKAEQEPVDPDEPEDGIHDIEADGAGAAIYDLQGRRVSAPHRGLYIVNGRKVLVK